MMINKHELGGNRWQNLLKDADSISYFENQAGPFLGKWAPLVGRKKVEDKIHWMFTRITSAQAKRLAKPMYKKFIKQCAKYYS